MALKPEQRTQKSILTWLKLQHPRVREQVVMIPNEGKKSVAGYALAKILGFHVGASDLFIAWPTAKYHGLWLEVKKDKWNGAKSSKEAAHIKRQMDFLDKMIEKGYQGKMVAGVDAAIQEITNYLNGK